MGYSYGRGPTGRYVLCCDKCGNATGNVRKRPCRYGWCQAIAICAACWHDPAVRAQWRDYHETAGCEASAREASEREARTDALLDSGAFVRCSAISGPVEGMCRVTFRNRAGATIETIMPTETYRAVPLLEPATMETYGMTR